MMKDRLNTIIESKGLTATKFAALIDANPSAISHLLKGRNKPGYDLLVNIARAFPEISMDWLLTGKGDMYNQPQHVKTNPVPVSEITPEEKQMKQHQPASPEKTAVFPEIPTGIPPVNSGKVLKRIILFFSDGSFEDYSK